MKQVQVHETSTSTWNNYKYDTRTCTCNEYKYMEYKGMRQACVKLHETGQLFGTFVN